MNKDWYECFITHLHNYVLLDSENDIRASANNIEGIVIAKQKFGWGRIFKGSWDGKIFILGEQIK